MTPMRSTAIRHSPAGYGLLARADLDSAQTRAWVEPCITEDLIRQDAARFVRGIDPQELLDISTRLREFDGPALLVWGTVDRFFTVDMARRLTAAFAHGRLVEVDGGRTFLPLDDPRRVAREIAAFVREGQVADVA